MNSRKSCLEREKISFHCVFAFIKPEQIFNTRKGIIKRFFVGLLIAS